MRQYFLDEEGIRWNGLTHGFRAFADYHPESDAYVALTANIQSGAGDLLPGSLTKILAGVEPEPAAAPSRCRGSAICPELPGLLFCRPCSG